MKIAQGERRSVFVFASKPSVPEEKETTPSPRSEEHTSELQSPCNLVCRLLLEKKKNIAHSRLPEVVHSREPTPASIERPNRAFRNTIRHASCLGHLHCADFAMYSHDHRRSPHY